MSRMWRRIDERAAHLSLPSFRTPRRGDPESILIFQVHREEKGACTIALDSSRAEPHLGRIAQPLAATIL